MNEEWKKDYDWQEAFGFADFSIDDVATVLHSDEGYNDGDSWLSFGKLKNGKYYFLSAWCDYTGWDCQSGGDSFVGDTAEEVMRFGMSDAERKRLGIDLGDARHEYVPPYIDGDI